MPFEIFKGRGGKFYIRLKATNGQIILSGEAYEQKASAKKGIQSIIRNTKDGDKRFDRRKSRKGDPYFVLLAKNGEPLGRSEMYKRKANMEKGIKSVIKNAPAGVIKDLT